LGLVRFGVVVDCCCWLILFASVISFDLHNMSSLFFGWIRSNGHRSWWGAVPEGRRVISSVSLPEQMCE
jgi:hypothetical protein